MHVLTRYVVREVCQVFAITLTALTLLLLITGVAREALSQGLGPVHILKIVPYVLPTALLFAVPATTLFAVTLTYGRMSSANELVALKSSGINPLRMLWPVLILATLLSFVTVWLNDTAMSWGYRGVQRALLGAVEDIIYDVLRTQKAYSTRGFSIVVRGVEGRVLIQPIFTLETTGDSPSLRITAKEAELRSVPEAGVLRVRFRTGTIERGGITGNFPGVFEHEIALNEAMHKGDASQAPAHLPLREIPDQIDRQRITISETEQRLAAAAGLEMFTGDLSALTSGQWASRTLMLQEQRQHLHRLQTEPPRRWANGFSCLCFALIGAPMAIQLKNANALTSFFACFLPILIVYYPFFAYGLDRAKAGAVPAPTVWLGNAVLAICGVWLLRRVLRH